MTRTQVVKKVNEILKKGNGAVKYLQVSTDIGTFNINIKGLKAGESSLNTANYLNFPYCDIYDVKKGYAH